MENNKDMQNNHIPKVSIGMPDGNGAFKPLITTIIPTYRRPKLLRRAIKSVLNQTYPHFQVCVYDNASGDETASVVAEMSKTDSRVKYHCHPENIGAIKNFIYGMEHVDTPFFTLLSDDDLILPNFFEIGMNALEKNQEAIFFAGATIRAHPDGNIWDVPLDLWRNGVYYPPEGFLEMLKKGHPEWTGIIFRKEVLSKIGIVDTGTEMASDLDFELRIAAKHPIVINKIPCAIFFSHPSSITSHGRLNSTWPAWLKMIENIDNIQELSKEMQREAHQLLIKRFRNRIFVSGIRGALNGFKEDTLQVSEILRNHFGSHLQASFFYILGKNSFLGSFLRSILHIVRFIRRFYRKKTIPIYWQSKYGNLENYIIQEKKPYNEEGDEFSKNYMGR